MAKPRGLGKGLEALFEDSRDDSKSGVTTVRLSEIEPNLSQPRKQFDEEALSELADSIAAHGVLQPLLIRPTSGGTYQIVAGERRWRAARLAGLTEVPALIREINDEEMDQLALIENLQREDLNAVETAQGYRRLMDKYGMTQEQLSEAVGKSRPASYFKPSGGDFAHGGKRKLKRRTREGNFVRSGGTPRSPRKKNCGRGSFRKRGGAPCGEERKKHTGTAKTEGKIPKERILPRNADCHGNGAWQTC